MLIKNKIAVIIPFFNEEKNIGKVIQDIPKFVDVVILINDGSNDNSKNIAVKAIETLEYNKQIYQFNEQDIKNINLENEDLKYFLLITHLNKKGKGAGIQTGYLFCKNNDIDCIASMDGDGQMDASELLDLCLPIVKNEADYTKGNRLKHPKAFQIIPKIRLFGIILLTYITKVCSGYWHVNDAQTGFTAISKEMLLKINVNNLHKEYGYPNDMLVRLNIKNALVKDIPITPIYPINGESKMNVLKVIPKISFLLFRLFFLRIWLKFVKPKV